MRTLTFLNYVFLIENRLDYLKGVHQNLDTSHDPSAEHKDAHDIIDHFAKSDPTPEKKHTQWIIGQYKKKNIRQEDSDRVEDTLNSFEKHKNQLPNKDLNSYKHIADLDDALEPHKGKVVLSSNEQDRIKKSEGADLIHNQNGVKIYRLKTKEAAQLYGKGTKWCTAAEKSNMFNHYNKEGPIHVLMTPDNRKYQFHNESNQFMNEKDQQIGTDEFQTLLNKHPSLKNEESIIPFRLKKGSSSEIDDFIKQGNVNHNINDIIFNRDNIRNHHIDYALKNHFEHLNNYSKEIIIKQGTDEHRNHFINEENDHIKHLLIANGNDKIKDHYIHDPNPLIRSRVAEYGNKQQKDKLINDPHHFVRDSVLDNGHPEHFDKLIHDENSNVRVKVAKVGTDFHRDKLINDPDDYVREQVARSGNENHRKILIHDPKSNVSDTAFRNLSQDTQLENIKHNTKLTANQARNFLRTKWDFLLTDNEKKDQKKQNLLNDEIYNRFPNDSHIIHHLMFHGNANIQNKILNEKRKSTKSKDIVTTIQNGGVKEITKYLNTPNKNITKHIAANINIFGNHEHRKYIYDNHKSHVALASFANYGNTELQNKILKDHENDDALHPRVLNMIAKAAIRGSGSNINTSGNWFDKDRKEEEVQKLRHKILDRPNLDDSVLKTIVKYGNRSHHEKIMTHPFASDKMKKYIAKKLKANKINEGLFSNILLEIMRNY